MTLLGAVFGDGDALSVTLVLALLGAVLAVYKMIASISSVAKDGRHALELQLVDHEGRLKTLEGTTSQSGIYKGQPK